MKIGRNMQGKNNPRYIDGRSHAVHFCNICKINKISYNNWRSGKRGCQYCKGKGSLNPNFKNNNTHNNKCSDCGKIVSKYSKRCMKCAGKITSERQRGKNNPMYGKPPTHGKIKKYKKIKFRSSWEVAYAKYLDKNRIKWQYEPKAFDLGNTTYTPDFYLLESDTWVEIKGYWRDDAKKKFDLFRKKYYSMNIILLMQKELKQMGILK
jgi:hypothetical protein